MRRLSLVGILLGAACGGPHPQSPEPQTPATALEQFLAAVKAKDNKRMGQLWGNRRGPVPDSPRTDSTLRVMQIYLRHAGFRIVEGPSQIPGSHDLITYQVELQAPNCNRVQPFDLVNTRRGGWLVYNVHLEAAAKVVPHCPPV